MCLCELWCGRCDRSTNERQSEPSYLLHHLFTLGRLTPYCRLAALFPFFFANFTTACFFLDSCVIIFMRSYFLSVFGFVVRTLYHIWKLTSLFIGSHHFNSYRILTDMYKIYSFVFAPLAKIAETQHKKRPQRMGESFAAFGKYCRTTYRAGRQTICQLKAQYAAGGCNAREGALPTLLN